MYDDDALQSSYYDLRGHREAADLRPRKFKMHIIASIIIPVVWILLVRLMSANRRSLTDSRSCLCIANLYLSPFQT